MSDQIGRAVLRPTLDDGQVAEPLSTPGFRDLYPYLCEFLAKPRGSGQNATTGTLTLFLSAGCFKLCINDRPGNRSAFVTGKTLHLALAAAEAGIAGQRMKWRTKGYIRTAERQMSFNRS